MAIAKPRMNFRGEEEQQGPLMPSLSAGRGQVLALSQSLRGLTKMLVKSLGSLPPLEQGLPETYEIYHKD